MHPAPDAQTASIIGAGSTVEAFFGAGALVLSILGLLGVLPFYMVSIATIAIGAGLLIETAGVAARYRNISYQTRMTEQQRSELGGGAGIGMLGGAAGVVLGILALLNVAPGTLLPVAAICFGVALTLNAAETVSTSSLVTPSDTPNVRRVTNLSAMIQVFTGVAAAVLGILVLVGVSGAFAMLLVAMLCVGIGELIVGAVSGTRRMNWRYRWF